MSQKRSTASALFATRSDPYNPALAAGFFCFPNRYGCFCEYCEQKCCRLCGQPTLLGLLLFSVPLKKKPRQTAGQCPSGIIGGVGGRGKRPRHLYYRPPPANSLIIFKEFFANFRIRLRFFFAALFGLSKPQPQIFFWHSAYKSAVFLTISAGISLMLGSPAKLLALSQSRTNCLS